MRFGVLIFAPNALPDQYLADFQTFVVGAFNVLA